MSIRWFIAGNLRFVSVMTSFRRLFGLAIGLFFLLAAPAIAMSQSSPTVVTADSTVPADDVIDIEFDELVTTTTSTSTTVAPTTTLAETLDMGIAEPRYLEMASEVVAGKAASGRTVSVAATGLAPNSKVLLVLQPENVVLVESTTDASGNATLSATLPNGVTLGSHMLLATGTTPAGDDVSTSGAFVVDSSGVVTGVVAASESLAKPPSLAELQRALDAGAPLYDTAANVATTAAVAVGAAVIGTVAAGGAAGGAGGSSGSGGSRSSSSNESGDGSVSPESQSEDRNTESQGEVGSIDVDELQKLEHDHESWGDKSLLWRLPGAQASHSLILRAYNWAESHSVLLSRVLIDGQWMRAALGPIHLVFAYVGMLLGVLGAISTGGAALLPPMGLVFVVIVMSMADALAGMLAWLSFTLVVAVSGGLSNLFDLRTLLGMAIVFMALPLVANHARPLRRLNDGTLLWKLDRLGDYLLAPIIVSFAASAALTALNGLSGLQLVESSDASQVRWLVGITVVCRMVIEDVVVRGFPQRLAATHLDNGDGLGVVADYGTVLAKGGLFLLASSSFFGLGWRTWLMVSLMTLVPFLKITKDRYPNFWWLKHWFPQGVLRTVMMIFVGSWFAQWVLSTSSSPNAARELAPLLMLPGVALGFIDLFGRSGDKWPNAVWNRLIAAGAWIFVLGIMLGRFSV